MEIKIDKNIPIPDRNVRGKWKDLANEMEVGDSVFVKTEGDYASLFRNLKASGFSSVRRAEAGGIRIWKINKIKKQ